MHQIPITREQRAARRERRRRRSASAPRRADPRRRSRRSRASRSASRRWAATSPRVRARSRRPPRATRHARNAPARSWPSVHGSGAASPSLLAFGGDVHFESPIRERLAASPASVLAPIAPVLRRADIAMVNLETAVTDRGVPAPKAYVFRAPASAFDALKAGGVDVATVANNHGMDFGTTRASRHAEGRAERAVSRSSGPAGTTSRPTRPVASP